MCGIAGLVSFDAPVARAELEPMAKAIAHRGPDSEGFFTDGPCGLAFRRLAVIDLVTGEQPMTARGATVAFNGEIYNYRELKAVLSKVGHTFRTQSDTEVLLHAYLQWGEQCTSRIDGMFAFALWDSSKRALFAARDRFGKKPFYFAVHGKQLLFGSELKALRAHRACPTELNPAALHQYLAFEYVPAPQSILKGVSKLEAGHQLIFDERGLRQQAYYTLPEAPKGSLLHRARAFAQRAEEDAAKGLRDALQVAVQHRLVADVPVGIFLSGGIDSTAIAALAMQSAEKKVQTFSIAFAESEFDESPHARAAAQALGTEHHEAHLTAKHCLDLIPKIAEQLDEPFADGSYVPTFLLSQYARRQVTVALGGDGADELFAGYEPFAVDAVGRWMHEVPAGALEAARRVLGHLPASDGYMNLGFKARTFLAGVAQDEAVRHQAWIGSFQPPELDALLRPEFRQGAADAYAPIRVFAQQRPERGLEWALRYYVAFYLAGDILTKVDRASMAASLEVRSPFLDTAVVEYVFKQPLHYKLRFGQRKWLLKRALKGLVPTAILRRKKHGFALPLAQWLKGPLRALRDELLSESALQRGGIFEAKPVRELIDAHDAGRADHRKPLWTLLMFELWRRRWSAA